MGFYIKGVDKFCSVSPMVMNSNVMKNPSYNREIANYSNLNKTEKEIFNKMKEYSK